MVEIVLREISMPMQIQTRLSNVVLGWGTLKEMDVERGVSSFPVICISGVLSPIGILVCSMTGK